MNSASTWLKEKIGHLVLILLRVLTKQRAVAILIGTGIFAVVQP
jgi:hypothetical protein